jgi:hypothetical protein
LAIFDHFLPSNIPPQKKVNQKQKSQGVPLALVLHSQSLEPSASQFFRWASITHQPPRRLSSDRPRNAIGERHPCDISSFNFIIGQDSTLSLPASLMPCARSFFGLPPFRPFSLARSLHFSLLAATWLHQVLAWWLCSHVSHAVVIGCFFTGKPFCLHEEDG